MIPGLLVLAVMGRKGGKVNTPKGFAALTPAQRPTVWQESNCQTVGRPKKKERNDLHTISVYGIIRSRAEAKAARQENIQ